MCDMPPLEPGAVLVLIERLAIEGARGSGHTGQDDQSEKGGQKGLHDRSPGLDFDVRSVASRCCSQVRYGGFCNREKTSSLICDEQ
jgi:hypothetical protein